MTLTIHERDFMVKLSRQNSNSAMEALQKFLSLKRLRNCPLCTHKLNYMIMKFEATRSLALQSERIRKPFVTQLVDDVVIPVEKDRLSHCIGCTSVRHIAETVDKPHVTVFKIHCSK